MPLNLSTKRSSSSSLDRDAKHHRSSIIWSPASEISCERHHNEENSVESVEKASLTAFQKRFLSENYNNNHEGDRKGSLLKTTNLFSHFDFEKIHLLNKSLSENSGKLKNASEILAAAAYHQNHQFLPHQQQQQQQHQQQQHLDYPHHQYQHKKHQRQQKSLGILKQNGTDIFVLNNNTNYNNNNMNNTSSGSQLDNSDDNTNLVFSDQHLEQRPDSTAHSESFLGGDFIERGRKERNFQVSFKLYLTLI
jgi:hypothetical protein